MLAFLTLYGITTRAILSLRRRVKYPLTVVCVSLEIRGIRTTASKLGGFPEFPDNIGCDPEEFLPNVLIGTNFSYTTGGYGLNLLSFQTLLGDTKRAILSHRREILWPYSYRGKFGKFGKTFRN